VQSAKKRKWHPGLFADEWRAATSSIGNKLFPRERLNGFDYFAGGGLLLVCWVSFFHFDIWATGADSLHYLFEKPLEFYENCKKARGLSGAYPPTIYAIYALWLYPLKLFGLVKDASSLPHYAAYWLKVLTTLVYLVSGIVFYKITQMYARNEGWGKYASALWLVSPLALFSQFIFSQSDIFYVFLALLGLLLFLKERTLAASVCFGFAVTFKYFPAFAFVGLLLLFEKKLQKLLVYLAVFALPTVLIHWVYGRSAAFQEEVVHHGAVGRVYSALLDIGNGWHIYYLFAVIAMLCYWAYVNDFSNEKLRLAAAYVFLFGSILPFLFIFWHPQWVLAFAPAILLTSVIDRRCDRFLVLDFAGMFCFVAFVSLAFQDNVDAAMFKSTLLRIDFHNFYKMARLFNWFGEHSADVFLSFFWAYLAIQLLLKVRLGLGCVDLPETLPVNYSQLRYRFYIGLLIFLLPASWAIYEDYRHMAVLLAEGMLVANEFTDDQKQHYGEVTKGRTFEQTFVAKGRTLEAVDLQFATFARQNSGLLLLEVLDQSDHEIARLERALDGIKDNAWEVFQLNDAKLHKGATYRLRLTSPTGQTGNAIVWWASRQNSYRGGEAIVDGVREPTDFAFRLEFSK